MDQKTHDYHIKTLNGKFFDVMDSDNSIFITDYSRLNKRIVLSSENSLKLDELPKRKVVASIPDLRKTLEVFISATIQILMTMKSEYIPCGTAFGLNKNIIEAGTYHFQSLFRYDFSINSSEKKLLSEQLVIDILFDKYIQESPLMTRNRYSDNLSRILYGVDSQRIYYARAINENLARGMKNHYNMMKYSNLRTQLEMLGINPDKFDEYFNPKIRDSSSKKKPKFIWDWFYYNYGRSPRTSVTDDENDFQPQYGHSTITSRQYRRQLTKDGRNYSYEEITNDLISYNAFINKILPQENESVEKYFRMSMDYYFLESYKRVDFMFKLISTLPQEALSEIDRAHFLVKWFHPQVLVPCTENDKLCFSDKPNYYRPLLFAEQELHKEIQKASFPDNSTPDYSTPDYSTYAIKLQKYQIIRAKAYELFKYHCAFHSSNYAEIKKFLKECYNMRSYHQSNAFWNLIQDKAWKDISEATKQQIKEQIQHFLSINDAFFWKSPDRNYTISETNKKIEN